MNTSYENRTSDICMYKIYLYSNMYIYKCIIYIRIYTYVQNHIRYHVTPILELISLLTQLIGPISDMVGYRFRRLHALVTQDYPICVDEKNMASMWMPAAPFSMNILANLFGMGGCSQEGAPILGRNGTKQAFPRWSFFVISMHFTMSLGISEVKSEELTIGIMAIFKSKDLVISYQSYRYWYLEGFPFKECATDAWLSRPHHLTHHRNGKT